MVFIGSGGLKEVLFIKIKYRHDGFSDQFCRILMAKMFIISAFVMSIDFFSDRVSCMVDPVHHERMSEEFVHSACWIQGFFVYEEMRYRRNPGESGYYGVPKNIEMDGLDENGHLCAMIDKGTLIGRSSSCTPLTKIYFVQYQYLSFYVASLAVIYYLPYLIFRFLNADMINLKTNVTKDEVDKTNVNKITDSYFNYDSNGGVFVLRLKILANLVIKMIYAFINIGGFLFTNYLLNNNFLNYGIEWIKWSRLSNSIAYDIVHKHGYPKPGNLLLPTMGICEINEGSSSRTSRNINEYKLICEISTHVLYQYVLLVLWFLFVAGIVVSSIGLILHFVVDICTSLICALPSRKKKCAFYNACKKLTLREIEYMKFIRTKNLPLYNAVLHNLLTETGV